MLERLYQGVVFTMTMLASSLVVTQLLYIRPVQCKMSAEQAHLTT